MLISDQDQLKQDIQDWTEKYGNDRSALIPILQEIQIKHQYITEHAMQLVADVLGLHPVEVYGVVSFYSFLDNKPKGKFIIRLCRTISCDMQGKDNVARQLENDLGIRFGQTTEDGLFTLEWASCLGMCDQGPAMLVNEQIFTHVTPEKVYDILAGCRKAFTSYAVQQQEEHIV
jgi:[NiFe] hydrogenase diaphorase moiety large subunit